MFRCKIAYIDMNLELLEVTGNKFTAYSKWDCYCTAVFQFNDYINKINTLCLHRVAVGWVYLMVLSFK